MLSHIHIQDFAIIDRLELELDTGMTALTGETGAGKSILVDALGLVLGDRADSGSVRHGCERAEIAASFELNGLSAASAWLTEHDLDADGECHLRRVITREGRSRAFINGRPSPLQSLRELGGFLVDIHGQHEHQSLLRRDTQRELLDDYGSLQPLLEQTRAAYTRWQHADEELTRLRAAEQDRGSRLELLRFQVQELDELGLAEGEVARINEEHGRLAHAGRLLETCQRAVMDLYDQDEDAIYSRLSHQQGEVAALTRLDPSLGEISELLNAALIQLQEAVDALRSYSDGLELDPARLDWLDNRLGTLHQLGRKHRVEPDALPGLLAQLRQELDTLDHVDQRLEQLQAERDACAARYREHAQQLSDRRQQAARRLGKQVSAGMQELGMPGGRFEIRVEVDAQRFHPLGMDQVSYEVSANPGQPLQALAKVASGGELSRISLALQVVAAGSTHVPSLVFDEVDTGIGGGVAEVVGRRLRTLGASHQVLCVTHLPQVAAQADQHLQVTKLSGKRSTRTHLRRLSAEERVEEVARMLGGVEITESTLAHAREMMEKQGKEARGKGKGKVKNA